MISKMRRTDQAGTQQNERKWEKQITQQEHKWRTTFAKIRTSLLAILEYASNWRVSFLLRVLNPTLSCKKTHSSYPSTRPHLLTQPPYELLSLQTSQHFDGVVHLRHHVTKAAANRALFIFSNACTKTAAPARLLAKAAALSRNAVHPFSLGLVENCTWKRWRRIYSSSRKCRVASRGRWRRLLLLQLGYLGNVQNDSVWVCKALTRLSKCGDLWSLEPQLEALQPPLKVVHANMLRFRARAHPWIERIRVGYL